MWRPSVLSLFLLSTSLQHVTVNAFTPGRSLSRTFVISQPTTATRRINNIVKQNDMNRMFTAHLMSKGDDNDDDESWDSDVDYSLDTPSERDEWTNDLKPKSGKLGIDIGKQMNMSKLSPEEAAALKAEATEKINEAFADRLDELEKLKEKTKREFERSKQTLNDASDLRATVASQDLMSKIDKLSGDFLKSTEKEREGIKMASEADLNMEGKGLDLGSWGVDEWGRDVAMEDGGSGVAGGGGVSVEGERVANDGVVSSKAVGKVLIVVDGSKNKQDLQVAEELSTLLNTKITCEIISPLRIPIGGGGTPSDALQQKTAILFANSLNDRGEVESILEKLLKRTANTGFPPKHIMLVSSLGTDRTNQMPYSMQNLIGGKLDKKKRMEEAVVSRCKMGLSGGTQPMDYTVVKMNAVADNAVKKNKNKQEADSSGLPVQIMPGDSLDGDIGVSDATEVLFQSIIMQYAARNATLSAVASSATAIDTTTNPQEQWNDMFLRCDGPELARINIGHRDDTSSQDKYELLSQYIQEWAQLFEDDNGKKMGLTTPVMVLPSKDNHKAQIIFKATNTGASYKSAKEERVAEAKRTKTGSSSTNPKKPSSTLNLKKAKKDGGIEVIVEQYPRLRVRAKRFNMDDKTVVKEMSEGIILKKLRDGIGFWCERAGMNVEFEQK